MPPDEHQISVNNSIYTNMVAALSVHLAQWAACLAGEEFEEGLLETWSEMARNLYFPYNHDLRYHEEYQGWQQDVDASKSGVLRVTW